ncbi:hypothetical protein IKW73_00425 [Candidatus Saccharibacteria bacterium]|nr:hypothetical protein [Candidatus Saccharibacteria bacterium]
MITELRYNTLWPDNVLYKEEADVIVAVIQEVMEKEEIMQLGSCFALYGVRREKIRQPKEMIVVNFASRYTALTSALLEEVSPWSNDRPTGIVDSPWNCCNDYLVLRTRCGCFTATLHTITKTTAKKRAALYAALALVFSQLRKDYEDEILDSGVKKILEENKNPDIKKVREFVDRIFETEELPEIQKWREWYTQNGPRGYFF